MTADQAPKQGTKKEIEKRRAALLEAKLPNISLVDLTTTARKSIDLVFNFAFIKDGPKGIAILGSLQSDKTKSHVSTVDPITVDHYYKGTISLDELCQGSEVRVLQATLMELIVNTLTYIDRSVFSDTYVSERIQSDPYISQSMLGSNGKDIRAELIRLRSKTKSNIPPEYLTLAPENIIPDTEIVKSVVGYLGEGVPCVAMIGPTGSGKSFTAKYIAGNLADNGFASMIIDANERTEGDRLFERDDFDSNGTFILEGTLLEFARRTKELGLNGLVVLEEYNAFSDSTRREFYRLFSDTDRYYQIESGNAKKLRRVSGTTNKRSRDLQSEVSNRVDFSHVQFLITANPITSDRYLVDDLRRLSNAESRRITMVYHDYAYSRTAIGKILTEIIKSKPIYSKLVNKYSNFADNINIDKGSECFTLLNSPDSHGDRLGFDFGYTSVANWIWTAAVRGNTARAWISASLDHLLNPIPDHELRKDVANKLEAKFGIKIGLNLIMRDA